MHTKEFNNLVWKYEISIEKVFTLKIGVSSEIANFQKDIFL